MKIAAAYIRVSTDNQLELSPDSQLKAIRDFAKSHDMILDENYIFMEDDGISGRKANKRPEFMRMISLSKLTPPPFDCLLVWKFSRFARNREESVMYKALLRRQCNVNVISVSEPISDGPFGSLIESIIEWMDEYYSINLSGEVIRGMTEKASRGGLVSAPPFGYDVSNGLYVPSPEEAPIVQMIFADFLAGMGCRQIAIKLNDMGIKSKRGNSFENRTVEYILRNPVYIGKIHWGEKEDKQKRYYQHRPGMILTDGQHDPIVDKDIFLQAQAKIKEHKLMYAKYAKKGVKREFMLRGMVKCSNCGSTLVNSRDDGLQCHSYAKGQCNQSHYIKIAYLTESVLDLAERLLLSDSFVLLNKSQGQIISESDLLIDRQKAMLDRARNAYLVGADTLEEYQLNKQKIGDEMRRLEALRPKPAAQESRKAFARKHLKTIKMLRDPNVPDKEKNELLRSFVDKIVFHRATNEVDIFFYQ